ncbi:tetratricopeptide repeat protein [Jejudonia soesokkakensis]|uniref:Tetratricopeptide repeat protein n=1 Tax=Jejudonia soesokkakensis TaxID=1323432 RepID=A0ABW2MNX9_9FLAO
MKLKDITLLVVLVFFFGKGVAQDDKQKQKELRQSKELLSEASLKMQKDNFPIAEAEYREAIALDPSEEVGKYNLGTAYYEKEKNAEAMKRFEQAAEVATEKPEKHKSYHNLGNTFMNEKKYKEAVEAYKQALRNNPTDDETRYNLALAKKMLEQNPNQGGGDDGDKEQNKKDENKEQDQKDNKDNQGDNNDQKKDQKEQDQGEKKEDKKEGDQQNDKGKPEEKEGEQEQKPQQPVPGKLSPQQVKSLLEAMNNQEKNVQEKINAQKTKGAKVKSNKDW